MLEGFLAQRWRRSSLSRYFDGETRTLEHEATTIKLKLVQARNSEGGKRAWDVAILYNERMVRPSEKLCDEFAPSEYDKYFKYYVQHSIANETLETESKRVTACETRIQEYGEELLRKLQLKQIRAEHHCRLHVIIEEDQGAHHDDNRSLHNIVFELLEAVELWGNPSPRRVTVTRIISPGNQSHPEAQENLGLQSPRHPEWKRSKDQPIRILLITGRDLRRKESAEESKWEYQEDALPHIIQNPLMKAICHLNELGFHADVQLDILYPATFEELRKYFETGDEQNGLHHTFDVIHLDMHGVMKSIDPSPSLSGTPSPTAPIRSLFNRFDINATPSLEPHFVFSKTSLGGYYVLASKLAALVATRTKLLVINSCNNSSETGELGIRMVRPFLAERIACVSAASYGVEQTPISIYHFGFYMSLLLYGARPVSLQGSFAHAAADGRAALRRNKTRSLGRQRDDYFMYWNWASLPLPLRMRHPVRPFRLLWLALYARISFFFTWLLVYLSRDSERQYPKDEEFPLLDLSNGFDDIQKHIDSAKNFDIPEIPPYALAIEHQLKTHHDHSIYLWPPYVSGIDKIRHIVFNMARIWVETNLVLEVHVVNVDQLLYRNLWKDICNWGSWYLGRKSTYQRITSRACWSWHQSRHRRGRIAPRFKAMLVIDGIHKLDETKSTQERIKALERINKVAKKVEKMCGEDYFLVTIGSLDGEQWKTRQGMIPSEHKLKSKWALPESMAIPFDHRFYIKPATFSRTKPISLNKEDDGHQ